jgi:hypothetical protein
MWIIPLSFAIYGALTPLYMRVGKGKLSNRKAFLMAWTTCPFFISYVYSPVEPQLLILIALNVIFYVLILKGLERYLSTGIALMATAVLLALVYNPI